MHAFLKKETAQLHKRLNRLPNARVLTGTKLTLPQYGRILTAFADAYGSVERELLQLEQTVELGCLQAYTPRLPAMPEGYFQPRFRAPRSFPGCIGSRSPSPAALFRHALRYRRLELRAANSSASIFGRTFPSWRREHSRSGTCKWRLPGSGLHFARRSTGLANPRNASGKWRPPPKASFGCLSSASPPQTGTHALPAISRVRSLLERLERFCPNSPHFQFPSRRAVVPE